MNRDSAAVLKAFLERPGHPEEIFTVDEFEGFFFALVCAPDLVRPSEWLPVVFGVEPTFESDEEVSEVMAAVMEKYNDLNSRLTKGTLRARVEIREPALENLEEDAPVAQWSRGFFEGHRWLEDAWLPDMEEDSEMERDFASALVALTFFASPGLAEAYTREMARPGKDIEALAKMCADVLVPASERYAAMGRALWKRALDQGRGLPPDHRGPAPSTPDIGRNDPCPCGSGKKFKRCCGRTAN